VKWAKFSEVLRPSPPDLKEIVNRLELGALFGFIKNGINLTGMPSFGLIEVPDPRDLDDRCLPQKAADRVIIILSAMPGA
jgi:hypothetical protein